MSDVFPTTQHFTVLCRSHPWFSLTSHKSFMDLDLPLHSSITLFRDSNYLPAADVEGLVSFLFHGVNVKSANACTIQAERWCEIFKQICKNSRKHFINCWNAIAHQPWDHNRLEVCLSFLFLVIATPLYLPSFFRGIWLIIQFSNTQNRNSPETTRKEEKIGNTIPIFVWS